MSAALEGLGAEIHHLHADISAPAVRSVEHVERLLADSRYRVLRAFSTARTSRTLTLGAWTRHRRAIRCARAHRLQRQPERERRAHRATGKHPPRFRAPTKTLAVARADVTRLEVSTGRRRHTWRGAGIGALVGVTSGAFVGYASGDDGGWCCFTAEAKAVMTGVGLGGLGAVIGAVVGSLTRSDRWISVPLGSAEATPRLQVGRGRAGLAVVVSF